MEILVLTRINSNFVHLITLNEMEWLFILSCINIIKESLPNLFIFFRQTILLKLHWKVLIYSYNGYANQSMDDHHFFWQMGFTQVITFVQTCKGNICTTNHHLLVLNGHNLDVTLNVVHKARGWGWFDSLPSHTSHVLQPLEIVCFKLSSWHLDLTKMFGH